MLSGFISHRSCVPSRFCHNTQVGSALNGDAAAGQELRVYAQPNCTGAATVLGPGARSTSVSGQSYLNYHAPGA